MKSETGSPLPGKSAFLAGLFLLCMCGLMLQVVETRVLSVIVYYNLAFVAISVAMLGMTVGALIVHFNATAFPRERLFESLTWLAVAFACAIAVSTVLVVTSILPAGSAPTRVLTLLLWCELLLVLAVPYAFAGMAISLALTRSPWAVGLVYGVDLLGAASGCLLILVLLNWMDGVSALIAIAAIAAFAGLCFSAARRVAEAAGPPLHTIARLRWFRRPAIPAVFFAAIAIGNAAIQPHGVMLMMAKNELERDAPAYIAWNSFSRVRAEASRNDAPALWGPSDKLPRQRVFERQMNIDGAAATAMYAFDGDLAKLDFLRYDVTNVAYVIRHAGRSAVIGVGGGRDLLSAYLFGFRDVTGVELNPIFIDMLTRVFRGYNHLADLPGVRLIVDEARSWFARTDEHFDLIEMSLIDTWAATGAGAYSLSENGLYTLQGWRHFIDALKPDGVFTVTRWYNPEDLGETGRLLSLAAGALRARGVDDPERHLFMAGTPELATLVLARAPFTAEEIAALRGRTEALDFRVLLSPDQPPAVPILGDVLAARTLAELDAVTARYHLNVSLTTDDRPFFFNELVLTDPESIRLAFAATSGVVSGNALGDLNLFMVMGLSGLLVLYAMIIPALSSIRQTTRRLAISGTFYFLLIGLGFMFIEIGLIQRLSMFLGHPVYGLAIGLFGIILSTGIGALISERLPLDRGAKIFAWAAVLFLYVVLLTVWFPRMVFAFEGGSLPVRALVALTAIVPSGILMGFGFPTGMRLVSAIDDRPTPWFWAVNGAAGVLGASVAVAISIAASINISLWIGATCYLLIAPVSLGLLGIRRGTTLQSA